MRVYYVSVYVFWMRLNCAAKPHDSCENKREILQYTTKEAEKKKKTTREYE